jgi:hypothetical protein
MDMIPMHPMELEVGPVHQLRQLEALVQPVLGRLQLQEHQMK